MKKLFFFLCLLSTVVFFQCANAEPQEQNKTEAPEAELDELGKIDLQVSGGEAAKTHFIDGLLLMHSFEYADAAEQFQKAQELDSTFVMAYWGEAMTKNHPLWRAQFTEEAQAILQRLAPKAEERLALAKTELEKDLLQGAELLFGEGSKEERDVLYLDHMESLHQKYPDNHEVSALYALSLLGSVKGGRDYDVYGKAAQIAKGIIAENNHHPGALHYMIHAYDDPDHAEKALQAANNYSKVAPDAGHALHMPSHIYIALGMWDEVIRANEVSYAASVERMKRKDLDNDALGYHAFKWTMYALMQKGEYAEARTYVEKMKENCYEKPSPRARSHFIQMRALYLNETNDWDDALVKDTVSFDDLIVAIQAVQHFTTGMAAYHQKDAGELAKTIETLDSAIRMAEKSVIMKGAKMCSGVSYYKQLPNKQDINRSKVILKELEAMAALLANDDAKVMAALEQAVNLEEETSFMFGPPEVIRPAPEFYGKYLLEQGKKKEAKAMFEKALERAPKRLIPTKALETITGR